MTQYLIQDYREYTLKGFLIENHTPENQLNNKVYFFNGAPMNVNKEQKTVSSSDKATIEEIAKKHVGNKKVLEVD